MIIQAREEERQKKNSPTRKNTTSHQSVQQQLQKQILIKPERRENKQTKVPNSLHIKLYQTNYTKTPPVETNQKEKETIKYTLKR